MSKVCDKKQIYGIIILFLPILAASLNCTEYGVCNHFQYVPAPPGHTPTCAKLGSTYCEQVDHYPMQLIKYLIEKWGYDYNTLLSDESEGEFAERKPVPYGPVQYMGHTSPQQYYHGPSPAIQPAISFGPLQLNVSYQAVQGTYPERNYKIDPHLLTNALQQPPGFSQENYQNINREGYLYTSPTLPPTYNPNIHSVQWWKRYRRSKDSITRRKRQMPSVSSTQLCPTVSSYIMPKAALNIKGSWMYTVNLNEIDNRYTQLVRSETCVSNQCNGLCSLPNGYFSRCQQKYVQKRLVALEGGGDRLYSDVFWFPHCCICEITTN